MALKSWPNLLRCINHRVCLDRKVAFSKPFLTNKINTTLDLKDFIFIFQSEGSSLELGLSIHLSISLCTLTKKLNISASWCSSFLGDTWKILIIGTKLGTFSLLQNTSIDDIKNRRVLDTLPVISETGLFKLRYMDTTLSHPHTFELCNQSQ